MPNKVISTRIDDLRLVLPPGKQPVKGVSGRGATVPSYEYPEVEDHRDVEIEEPDKKPQPTSGDEEYDKLLDDFDNSSTAESHDHVNKAISEAEEDRKGKQSKEGSEGEEGGAAKPGEESDDSGPDGPPSGSTAAKGAKDLKGKSAIKLHKAGDVQVTGESIKPGKMTARDMDIWRAKAAEQRHRAINHEKSPASVLKKARHRQGDKDSGFGLVGEFGAVGYTPPNVGLWKKVFKGWLASIIQDKPGPSWFKNDMRTRVIRTQMLAMGSHIKMKNPEAPGGRPHKHRILAFVDVSGSVFNMKIQSEFAKVLMGVPKDKAEVLIWTFDAGIQQGPFTPQRFNPTRGGGGTEAFEAVAEVLSDPMYARPDGIVFLTDGEFTSTKPHGISAKQMCFVLTKINSKSHIPPGAKIIDTSIEAGEQ